MSSHYYIMYLSVTSTTLYGITLNYDITLNKSSLILFCICYQCLPYIHPTYGNETINNRHLIYSSIYFSSRIQDQDRALGGGGASGEERVRLPRLSKGKRPLSLHDWVVCLVCQWLVFGWLLTNCSINSTQLIRKSQGRTLFPLLWQWAQIIYSTPQIYLPSNAIYLLNLPIYLINKPISPPFYPQCTLKIR